MKKTCFCFLVLFASFILAVQSFGQNSQSDSIKFQGDSVKTDLNLSSEVVKKLDNKDIVEIFPKNCLLNHKKSDVQIFIKVSF